MFLGIALGVLVGCYPFTVGNMPVPLRLGLAGGPLLTAIILSRIGCTGPLLWYLPANANLLLREFGIVLFLSCVGLKSGTHFVETLFQGQGFLWMAMGAVITLAPIMIISLIARCCFENEFRQPVRLAGRKPDRSAGPGFRPRDVRLGGAFRRLCLGISLNHGAAHRRSATAGVVFCGLRKRQAEVL